MTIPPQHGFLWHDSEKKKPLEVKILEGIAYARKKYDCKPQTCHINPVNLPGEHNPEEPIFIADLEIISDDYMLINDFWLIP